MSSPISLSKTPGFSEWASTPETQKFLFLLSELVDVEVGRMRYPLTSDAMIHINFGIMEATRRAKHLLRNPLEAPEERAAMPRATYQVKPEQP